MKTLLFFILCLSAVNLNGQNYLNGKLSDYLISDTIDHHKHFKSDTVRVLMLVCDTISKQHSTQLGSFEMDIDYLMPKLDHFVYWNWGYSVRKFTKTWSDGNVLISNTGDEINGEWVHVKYLDDKKQPLKKGFFVWMSVKVNGK